MSDEQTDERFINFDAPKWGIRAIARTLITYQDKRTAVDGSAIDTVADIINRWAPSHENPTNAYSTFVADRIDRSALGVIDVYEYDVMFGIVKAIIHFENGSQPYDDATIDQGLRLAGIDVPVKALKKSRTIKAATIATIGTTLTAAADTLQPLLQYSDGLNTVFIVLTLASIGVMVWSRIDDAQKESRT
jgi:hypothetical protein